MRVASGEIGIPGIDSHCEPLLSSSGVDFHAENLHDTVRSDAYPGGLKIKYDQGFSSGLISILLGVSGVDHHRHQQHQQVFSLVACLSGKEEPCPCRIGQLDEDIL